MNKILTICALTLSLFGVALFWNVGSCEASCVPSPQQEQRIFDAAINASQLAGLAVDRDKVREELENIRLRERRRIALQDGARIFSVGPLTVNVLHHGEGVSFTEDGLVKLDDKGAIEMEIFSSEAGESAVTLFYRHSPMSEVQMIGTMDINETRHQIPSQPTGGDLSFTETYELLKGRNRVVLRAADIGVSFYPIEIVVGRAEISSKLARVDLSNKVLVIDELEGQVGDGAPLDLIMKKSIEGDVFFRVGDDNTVRTPPKNMLLEFRFADNPEFKPWSYYQETSRYIPIEFVKRTSVQLESNVLDDEDLIYFLYVSSNLEASPSRGFFRARVPQFLPGGPKSSNEVEVYIE